LVIGVKEVALMLQVCHKTATFLLRSGAIRGFQFRPKGAWKTTPEQVREYIRQKTETV
jgi:predicted site-specific integrase-resolvase